MYTMSLSHYSRMLSNVCGKACVTDQECSQSAIVHNRPASPDLSYGKETKTASFPNARSKSLQRRDLAEGEASCFQRSLSDSLKSLPVL